MFTDGVFFGYFNVWYLGFSNEDWFFFLLVFVDIFGVTFEIDLYVWFVLKFEQSRRHVTNHFNCCHLFLSFYFVLGVNYFRIWNTMLVCFFTRWTFRTNNHCDFIVVLCIGILFFCFVCFVCFLFVLTLEFLLVFSFQVRI